VDDTRRDNRHGWHPTDPDPVAKYVAADGGLVEACRYCGEPTGHDGSVCYGCCHAPEQPPIDWRTISAPGAALTVQTAPVPEPARTRIAEALDPDGGERDAATPPAWAWALLVLALLAGSALVLFGR
jgi:hypothetical protein